MFEISIFGGDFDGCSDGDGVGVGDGNDDNNDDDGGRQSDMPKDQKNSPEWGCLLVKTLRPRQNRRYFADDIFKCIFLNENVWIPIEISLKFVPKGPINNIPALV